VPDKFRKRADRHPERAFLKCFGKIQDHFFKRAGSHRKGGDGQFKGGRKEVEVHSHAGPFQPKRARR